MRHKNESKPILRSSIENSPVLSVNFLVFATTATDHLHSKGTRLNLRLDDILFILGGIEDTSEFKCFLPFHASAAFFAVFFSTFIATPCILIRNL